MSYEAAKKSILSALSTLPAVLAGYQIVWPNVRPTTAESSLANRYAVVSIIWGKKSQADIGTAGSTVRERAIGIVQISMHENLNVGEAAVLALADDVEPLVRRKTVGAVRFKTPSVYSRGRTQDGRHWRVDVEAPFYVDQVI